MCLQFIFNHVSRIFPIYIYLILYSHYYFYIFKMEKNQTTYVFIWGMGQNKSLGNAKKANQTVPFLVKQLNHQVCTKISTGNYFTVVATQKGQLYGWGVAKHSRFGFNQEIVQIPRKIPFNKIVVQVAAGNWHTVVIDNLGDVYGVGHNKYGALGIGNFNQANVFTKSIIPEQCKKVACGDGFSLFLTQENVLYSSGHNSYHGLKSKQNIHTPSKIVTDQKFQFISAGFTHSACVTVSGELYTWGEGTFYQLGHNSKNDEKVPRKVQALVGKRIVQASCTRGQKNAHTMAVDSNGFVYTWGAGYKGKLGHQSSWSHSKQGDQPIPRQMQNIKNIKICKAIGGGIHSSIITQDNRVMTFGCGSDGRLGHKQSQQYVYLYREGFPKQIEGLKDYETIDYSSSYYHNACICVKRK